MAESESDEGPDGESVEMDESVGGSEASVGEDANEGRGDDDGDENGNEGRGAYEAGNGRPDYVELLFNGEAPCRADGAGEREHEEILHKENVVEPRSGFEFVPRPPLVGGKRERHDDVDEQQQEDVDRPDAKSAARVEVLEEMRIAAGVRDDAGDEEPGENEEEIDAG